MPHLSRWILLRPENEASRHLIGHQRAQHSCEPVCTAGSHCTATTRVGYPGSTEDARRLAAEHRTRSSGGAKEGLYLVQLTDVSNSFVTTAAGASRARSRDVRHNFDHERDPERTALRAVECEKYLLTARRHTAQSAPPRRLGRGCQR